MSKKTKTAVIITIAVVLTAAIIFTLFIHSGRAGIAKMDLKDDFITKCDISSDCNVKKSVGYETAGVLAFSEDTEKIFFGFYEENAIGRYSYFTGDNLSRDDNRILKYILPDCKSAVYVSANNCRISEIRVYDDILEPEIIKINPDRPFILAEPRARRI